MLGTFVRHKNRLFTLVFAPGAPEQKLSVGFIYDISTLLVTTTKMG